MLGWFKPVGAPPTFEERAPHEQGFAAQFARAVAPRLHRLELLRRIMLVAFWGILAVGLPVVAGIAWFALDQEPRLLRLAAFVLICTVGLALVPVAFFMGREERLLLPAIAEHLGGLRAWIKPRASAAVMAPFRALGLVPPLDPRRLSFRKSTETVKIDDLFTGGHRGIGMWMAELEDVQKHGSRETRLFRGTLIELTLPDAHRLYTSWRVRLTSGSDPSQLALESLAEEEASGDPPIDLATPAVQQAIGDLARVFVPGSLIGACDGDALRLALTLKGRSRPFSVGNPFVPVYRCEPAVRTTLAQLAAVLALIDALADAIGAGT